MGVTGYWTEVLGLFQYKKHERLSPNKFKAIAIDIDILYNKSTLVRIWKQINNYANLKWMGLLMLSQQKMVTLLFWEDKRYYQNPTLEGGN